MSEDAPFWLKGNLAPVHVEQTLTELEVTGHIPAELNGRVFRNGPNPAHAATAHWFLGNGMIHGVELQGGRVSWYRNRYVRTPLFEHPEIPRITLDAPMDRRLSLANTHVIHHAGKILALEEGAFPWMMSPTLETLGPWDFEGRLKTAMTAHPRVCPVTGELLFFAYDAAPPYLTYHRVAADGALLQSEPIELPRPVMMHDWNVTRNFIVFMDLPLIYDFSLFTLEHVRKGIPPLRWAPEIGARLGVMPRAGGNREIVWYPIDPCYVFHTMNAYEAGDTLVVDTARFPSVVLDDTHFPKTGFGPEEPGVEPATLHRWVIDRQAHRVTDTPLDDRPAEFPRVADSVVGLPYRYGYMMATTGGRVEEFGQELYKYDLERGNSVTWELPAGQIAGEPFPAMLGAGEDEGYVMTFVYDRTTGRSDLVILDATRFAAGPVARIHLPCRVPDGFHGGWIPDPR